MHSNMHFSKQAHVPVAFGVVKDCVAPRDDPSHTCTMLATKDFRILSLQHEDGSGYSFNIEGYCKARPQGGKNSLTEHRYTMYYNAKTRKGTITFETK